MESSDKKELNQTGQKAPVPGFNIQGSNFAKVYQGEMTLESAQRNQPIFSNAGNSTTEAKSSLWSGEPIRIDMSDRYVIRPKNIPKMDLNEMGRASSLNSKSGNLEISTSHRHRRPSLQPPTHGLARCPPEVLYQASLHAPIIFTQNEMNATKQIHKGITAFRKGRAARKLTEENLAKRREQLARCRLKLRIIRRLEKNWMHEEENLGTNFRIIDTRLETDTPGGTVKSCATLQVQRQCLEKLMTTKPNNVNLENKRNQPEIRLNQEKHYESTSENEKSSSKSAPPTKDSSPIGLTKRDDFDESGPLERPPSLHVRVGKEVSKHTADIILVAAPIPSPKQAGKEEKTLIEEMKLPPSPSSSFIMGEVKSEESPNSPLIKEEDTDVKNEFESGSYNSSSEAEACTQNESGKLKTPSSGFLEQSTYEGVEKSMMGEVISPKSPNTPFIKEVEETAINLNSSIQKDEAKGKDCLFDGNGYQKYNYGSSLSSFERVSDKNECETGIPKTGHLDLQPSSRPNDERAEYGEMHSNALEIHRIVNQTIQPVTKAQPIIIAPSLGQVTRKKRQSRAGRGGKADKTVGAIFRIENTPRPNTSINTKRVLDLLYDTSSGEKPVEVRPGLNSASTSSVMEGCFQQKAQCGNAVSNIQTFKPNLSNQVNSTIHVISYGSGHAIGRGPQCQLNTETADKRRRNLENNNDFSKPCQSEMNAMTSVSMSDKGSKTPVTKRKRNSQQTRMPNEAAAPKRRGRRTGKSAQKEKHSQSFQLYGSPQVPTGNYSFLTGPATFPVGAAVNQHLCPNNRIQKDSDKDSLLQRKLDQFCGTGLSQEREKRSQGINATVQEIFTLLTNS